MFRKKKKTLFPRFYFPKKLRTSKYFTKNTYNANKYFKNTLQLFSLISNNLNIVITISKKQVYLRFNLNFIAWRWLERIIAGEYHRPYLDHFRRCRIRAEIHSWHQLMRRTRPESQQHSPVFLSGNRLSLHRDQNRAVLTVPSHEIYVFLRKKKSSR